MLPAELTDPMMGDLIPAQFTASTMVVWAIDLLKRANWFPCMSTHTENINRTVAIAAAALTAAGLHFAMEPMEIEGQYMIKITGISFWTLVHFIKGFMVNISVQQTILKLYQGVNLLRHIAGTKDTIIPASSPHDEHDS